jgi:hypothetical protein
VAQARASVKVSKVADLLPSGNLTIARIALPRFSKDAMIFLPMGKLWGISWGIDRGIAREQWGKNGCLFPIFLG